MQEGAWEEGLVLKPGWMWGETPNEATVQDCPPEPSTSPPVHAGCGDGSKPTPAKIAQPPWPPPRLILWKQEHSK